MKKIIFLALLGILLFLPNVSAETLKLDKNVCTYQPEINKDYCYTEYEICESGINVSLIEMKYADMEEVSEMKVTEDDLKIELAGLNTEIDIKTTTPDCRKIELKGWKSPLTDIDNVLCYDDNCHLEYALWNGTYTYRIAIWGNIATLTGDTEGLIPIQVTINASTELFHCQLTMNQTNHTIGYVYFNNNTDYICVDKDESSAVTTVIDEGNGVDYGTVNETITGFYTMNGTDIFDHSIYARHGENQSGMVTDDGKIGNGIYFNGNNEYFEIGNMLSSSATFSISMWVNFTGANEDAIISKYAGANSFYRYLQTQAGASGGKLYTYADTGTPAFDCVTSGNYSDNTFHHIVIAYTATTCKIYVDGSQDSSQTTYGAGSLTPFSYAIRTGERNDGVLDYAGMIDNMKIFNRSLSADEIRLEALAFDNINYGSNETNTTTPTPPVTNLTLDFEITFCYDATYLYIKEKDLAENGSAVFNEYLQYCEEGCNNNSLTNLGRPGCQENIYGYLLIFAFFVVLCVIILRVAK